MVEVEVTESGTRFALDRARLGAGLTVKALDSIATRKIRTQRFERAWFTSKSWGGEACGNSRDTVAVAMTVRLRVTRRAFHINAQAMTGDELGGSRRRGWRGEVSWQQRCARR
jgi:hypothetical protein